MLQDGSNYKKAISLINIKYLLIIWYKIANSDDVDHKYISSILNTFFVQYEIKQTKASVNAKCIEKMHAIEY